MDMFSVCTASMAFLRVAAFHFLVHLGVLDMPTGYSELKMV